MSDEVRDEARPLSSYLPAKDSKTSSKGSTKSSGSSKGSSGSKGSKK